MGGWENILIEAKGRAWESGGHVTYMWPLKIPNIRHQLARDWEAGAKLSDK